MTHMACSHTDPVREGGRDGGREGVSQQANKH